MKEFLAFLFLLLPVMMIYARQVEQPIALNSRSATNIPHGFNVGSLLTIDSVRVHGCLKDNIKYKSEVVLLQSNGTKIIYKASQLLEATIDSIRFVSISGDWYKIIEQGKKINLLRKASAGTGGIEYNGVEPVIVPAAQGGYNDYFMQPVAGHQLGALDPDRRLIRVSKTGFEKTVQTAFGDCPALLETLKNRELRLQDITWLVTQYNNCP